MREFETPAQSLGALDADLAARLIAAAADVTLILDHEGVIRDMAFGSDDLRGEGYAAWLGKPWAETVTPESRPKVEALLRDSQAQAAPRWRHINHPSVGGADLPLSYAAVALPSGGREQTSGRAVVFGRDLRPNAVLQQKLIHAQQTMERDYWRLRHLETRYRALFQVAGEAVLIVDAASGQLDEANPAAAALFGAETVRPGWLVVEGFADPAAVKRLLDSVRATGQAASQTVSRVGQPEPLLLSVSLFRHEQGAHLLLRVSSGVPLHQPPQARRDSAMLKLIDQLPDAFVVTDLDGRVQAVNQAFLALAQLPSEAQALGQPLDQWLGRTGVDVSVLLGNLRQRGVVRLFATVLRGASGVVADVEISAVAVAGETPCLGLTIRDVGRRLSGESRADRELPRSVGQMTELVGRVPLKDIVRDTADLIEQLCIEAALELTHDNRASAAEMLGLSRQSLYVKLRRFNLGDLAPASNNDN